MNNKNRTIKISYAEIQFLIKAVRFTAGVAHKKLFDSMRSYYDEDSGVHVSPNELTAFERVSCFSVMGMAELVNKPLLRCSNLTIMAVNNSGFSPDLSDAEQNHLLNDAFSIELTEFNYNSLQTHSAALIQCIFVYLSRDKQSEIDNATVADSEYYIDESLLNRKKEQLILDIKNIQKNERKIYKNLARTLSDL